jgi:hypothetical protein
MWKKLLWPDDGGSTNLRNVDLFSRIYGSTAHKSAIFITKNFSQTSWVRSEIFT